MAGKALTVFFFTFLILAITTRAEAIIIIDGIEFEDNAFADSVSSFTPGTGFVDATHSDPTTALGVPDYTGDNTEPTFVSLGNGDEFGTGDIGELILQFTDNYLTTSGDSGLDLWIFEIGGVTEATAVYISTDALSWISVGEVGGATSGIDIDGYAGVVLEELYSYVRLVDITTDTPSGSPWSGADIDAVGAISSIAADPDPEPDPTPIPEPSTTLLLVAGLLGLAVFRARFEPSR